MDIVDVADEESGTEDEKDTKKKDKASVDGLDEEKESEYEDVCFICRRPESKTGKMFKLPNHISVCSDCMHKTMDTVSQFDYQGMLNNTNFNFDKDNGKDGRKHFPNISFVNIADLQGDGEFPTARSSKRKSPRKRRTRQCLTSTICRRPTRLRHSWTILWSARIMLRK